MKLSERIQRIYSDPNRELSVFMAEIDEIERLACLGVAVEAMPEDFELLRCSEGWKYGEELPYVSGNQGDGYYKTPMEAIEAYNKIAVQTGDEPNAKL